MELSDIKSHFQFLENIREWRNKADNSKKKQTNPECGKTWPHLSKVIVIEGKGKGRAEMLRNVRNIPNAIQNP